ncbi:hypothetical protein [Erythrobacter sp. THAF29]|uniref:hypothetical protein n=1 Tax=Erythrobacter sp. THAF29 TaxID=2587851 RepID=UPI00126854DD|nr:hypothetical protein [Erythrobacter sp. THAF29]QFT78871.1 hypothetical protein FIU90_15075 [Erythrobacter sp. THAF29]
MKRNYCLQTYVTAQVDDWIKAKARERGVSSSIVVGDCIHDAWMRDMEADLRTPATDPVRQNIFITVALDALLTYHPEADLRDLVVDAYHRRLVRLGLVAPRSAGDDHGE